MYKTNLLLKTWVEKVKLSQNAFASLTGQSARNINYWISENTEMKLSVLEEIGKKIGKDAIKELAKLPSKK